MVASSLPLDGRVVAGVVAPRNLINQGVQGWVIIHFPEAVYAYNKSGQGIWQLSLRVPPGAGDALAAGVLRGLHEDRPMADCLHLGVCVAASSLYHASCSEGVQPEADCLGLARRLGYNLFPA